ncbi:MAG: PQQ-dependent sugar dehydrogenase [Armatimonas sp.]
MKKILPISIVLVGLLTTPAGAQTEKSNKPPFRVEVVARNLQVVWSIVFPSKEVTLLTERPGTVRALVKGQLLAQPLLTLTDIDATFKLGAMGLTLHPSFAKNHWVYLAYSYKGPEGPKVRVVRYTFDEKALLQSPAQALTNRTTIIENIPAFTNHAGCRLRFGPDKKLYITTGDANVPDLAQKLDSLAGKMLRLNDDGTIPKDNPFVGRADARPEIWTYGHRNSQGFDFQPGTNLLFESEHGPVGGDEINIIEKGKNYGWPVAHHELFTGGMEPPLLLYGLPSLAPGSGSFYRGKLFPQYRGDFFVGCMRSECILRVKLQGRRVISQERLLEHQYGRIREVAEAPDGSIYFSTSMMESDGRPLPEYDQILRLVPG